MSLYNQEVEGSIGAVREVISIDFFDAYDQ